MNKDIAIIGMAGRFPDAKNLDELFSNLRNGNDSVGEISQDRIRNTALNPGGKYLVCGYLEDIDKFDHKLFKISKGEAETMSPVQRQLLEVVYETFESSGYSIEYFNGSKTAIFIGASSSDYYKHADNFVPTLISGNHDAYLPAIITRQFNLTGNAQMINTACSSSLAAVHQACNELILENADYALACGVNLYIFPYSKTIYTEGDKTNLDSPDGKSKAFSSEANGMSHGEAVASILLKPLDKALKDKDIIYAVIKSTVMNNNARRSDSLKAVDAVTQSELLKEAWEKAGIAPEEIGYIEAHGSGTKWGDALEVQGVNMAIKSYGISSIKSCPISTIKSNIGHTRMAAGIAGLVRAVMSLKYKVIFPTACYKLPSPLIDFENSFVYVNESYREWKAEGNAKRYAGVTSLGESGINCHVVLSEAPDMEMYNIQVDIRPYLITVSSSNQEGLVKNLIKLRNKILKEDNIQLRDISYTLNTGRKHYEFRFAVIVDSIEELNEKIDEYLNVNINNTKSLGKSSRLIFMFTDHNFISEELLEFFTTKYKIFRECYKECTELCNLHNNNFKSFAFQYSLYKQLEAYGISTKDILGIGIGKLIYNVISGKATLEEIIEKVVYYQTEEISDVDDRVERLIEREAKYELTVFAEIGPKNTISAKLKEKTSNSDKIKVLYINEEENCSDPMYELVRELYLSMFNINWDEFCKHNGGRKIELPHYQFEKTRCWLRDESKEVQNAFKSGGLDEVKAITEENVSEVEEEIRKYWQEILEINTISVNADFFELGGSSLRATHVINRINNGMGLCISFEDIFDYPTVRLLAGYVSNLLGIEEKIAMFWKQVLKVDKVEPHDDFFELGGHSLLASQVLVRIKKEFRIDLNFEDIFEHPTLDSLTSYVKSQVSDEKYRDEGMSIQPAAEKEFYQLSSAQKRMYMLNQMDKANTSYNEGGAGIIEGSLDAERFEEAFRKIIKRHESLRTSFHMKNGEPVQKIHKEVEFKVRRIKASEEEVEGIIKGFICPFDLSEAPLLRVGLVEISEDRHIFIFIAHHIISDGTSMQILKGEFMKLYSGQELPEIRLQYKDFSEWQNRQLGNEAIKKQEKYWLEQFRGEIPVLGMPSDYQRPIIQSHDGDRIHFNIGKALEEKLKEAASATRTTLYMVLLAAYNTLLYKYTGQEDIVVGSPIAGRQHADLENVVGMFVNTLAMRNHPVGEKTFVEFLEEVKETSLKAFENQTYQFEELVGKLDINRDMSRNAVFDVLFVLQNMRSEDLLIKEIKFRPYAYENKTSKFDMTLQAYETKEGISFDLEYCTALYKRETIERISHHFVNILECITRNLDTKLCDIEMLSEEEKQQILFEFNNTKTEYPKDKTIHQLFEEQAAKTPDSMAVVYKDKQLTYRELDEKSNQLARFLREKGVKSESIVGIMVERSIEMIVGILGILKAGGAYLSIDPQYPEDRVRYMLEDSGAEILLTDHVQLINDNLKNVVNININDQSIDSRGNSTLNHINMSNHLAYIMYTSGSTGKPKGVMVEHKNVVRLVKDTNYIQFKNVDTILQTGATVFDASTFEIWGSMLNGLRLYIVDEDTILDANKLEKYLIKYKVTTLWLTSPLFNQLANQKPEMFRGIKNLLVGGDVLSPSNINRVRKVCRGVKIINGYGPTENTTFSACFSIERDYESNIPIGKPISNSTIYIVDHNSLQPIGAPGEICVGGDGLARGYLNQPELTAEKFVANPFEQGERMYRTGDLARWLPDGNIEFMGRIDHQVKIRGFRIELGEIESQLLKHVDIMEAAVIANNESSGEKYLCAYIVSKEELPVYELRNHLSKELPDYMIPSYFVQMEKLPLTSNGKVDRRALTEPDRNLATDKEYVEPTNETEKKLAAIWQEVLGVEKIGINDNFFELGGHSLKAVLLLSRIHKEMNVEVSLKVVFASPVLRNMAEYLKEAAVSIYKSIEPVTKREYYPLSSAQKRIYILNQLERESLVYNIPGTLVLEGELDKEKLEEAIRKLIARHETLRTSFELAEGEPVQRVHEKVEFHIEYYEQEEDKTPDKIEKLIKPFDLGRAPLLRVVLIKIKECRHIMLFDIHHIIADGMTMNVIKKEVAALYSGKELPALRLQYKDYALWQHELLEKGIINKQEEYWFNVFNKEIPVLNLPIDYLRPAVKSFVGSGISFEIDKELTDKLNNLILDTGTTMFMLILATYNVLLSKYSGQEDIIVGTPIAGRQHPDLENLVGMFINTIAMRNYPKADMTFKQFLNKVKENSLSALENQEYQFDQLIEKLNIKRDLSRNPIFDVWFNYLNIEVSEIEAGELLFLPYESEQNTVKFDLCLYAIQEDRKIKFRLDYSTALFRKETIERVTQCFENILNEVAATPDIKISKINMLSNNENRQEAIDIHLNSDEFAAAFDNDEFV